ncbi:MAG TPA: glycosyltransferase family 2 protein [Syntrophorhabdaceae bacterium]|nr:glycosyltransferase family 2 protein [Syntrophorhabdaceae bacterium]
MMDKEKELGNRNHSSNIQPGITAVVAVLNGAATIGRCIDSVAGQTYRQTELIIVDGGSSDETVEILKNNAEKITYWKSEKDNGIYNAWNKALERVRGEWVIFLGADDFFWDSSVLKKLAPYLMKVQETTKVVYCQSILVDGEGNELTRLGQPWSEIKRRFPYLMGIPHSATFYRRSVFDDRGKFDESFHIAGDFEFLLREFGFSEPLFIPDLVTTGMQYGGISSIGSNGLLVLKEMRTAQKRHGFRIPGFCWIVLCARVRLRMILQGYVGNPTSAKLLDWGRRFSGRKPFWTRI